MRRVILYGILFFQVLLIISLVRGIQLSLRSSSRINALQASKDKLVAEQAKLKQEGEYVQSQYYLEKVAREELHLSKPGETVVIIPEGRIASVAGEKTQASLPTRAIWQQWVDILLGRDQL